MPPLSPLVPTLWAQVPAPPPQPVAPWLLWLFTWGEPAVSVAGPLGSLMTWTKVVGLFCLLGWVASWTLRAVKNPPAGRTRLGLADMAIVAALIVTAIAAALGVMVGAEKLPQRLSRMPLYLAIAAGALALLWVETKLWSVLRRMGGRADLLTLVGMHLALGLGFAVAFLFRQQARTGATDLVALMQGGRLGATYMGLVVLARIASLLIPEVAALRWRRVYAIAWQSWVEAFRRMWAPWVVLAVFLVILAFTAWFLQPTRQAEMGRLYIGTLMLLCSILLTLTVVILAPISLPNDIRQQTIFTVVSKPVRRLELIWGRMLGYMALITLMMLVIGGISLGYFYRQINAAIAESDTAAAQAAKEGKVEFAKLYRDQAEQLRSRLSARVPINGSLVFFDAKGVERSYGIDVGMELPTRSFVEGATPSRALWRFGAGLVNPRNRNQLIDRVIPTSSLLRPGTIEWVEDQLLLLADDAALAQQARQAADLSAAQSKDLTETISRAQAEMKGLQAQRAELLRRETELRAKKTPDATAQADGLHSPSIPVEMSFTVYRTTKGEVGEPVYASIVATSPRQGISPWTYVFPIREYYTNKLLMPSRVLVGSRGGLNVEIKCLSPNQYLGMAEADLFLLSSEGRFWANFLRGLGGVWLQAMILTAIGVFAGTFLSWPVALLTTVFFFLAGNAGFTSLQQFALARELVGGGPFESLVRTLGHENLVSELAPTTGVVVAKTLDSMVMPIMARLVYVVPNFAALDVSETVASGFSVGWGTLGKLVLLALAYALPFSIAGYFILRNREVAA